jgi:hypothetical protein
MLAGIIVIAVVVGIIGFAVLGDILLGHVFLQTLRCPFLKRRNPFDYATSSGTPDS